MSSNTLHGIFIKNIFGGNEIELEKQIYQSLESVQCLSENKDRLSGNKVKYPLGTVVTVSKGEQKFFLLALTRFNSNNRSEIKKSEYIMALCTLFDYIEQNSQGYNVSIPLIGAGHSGIDLSKQKILDLILLSINIADKLTLINGLNIVLHESNNNELDLNLIEHYFNI